MAVMSPTQLIESRREKGQSGKRERGESVHENDSSSLKEIEGQREEAREEEKEIVPER